MIILTSAQATAVRGISPLDSTGALAPRLLTDGNFAMSENVLTDEKHADIFSTITPLTKRAVASNEYETNTTLLNAVPFWRTVGTRAFGPELRSSNIPEGFDNGAIIYTVPDNPTPYEVGGPGMVMEGPNVVLDDKVAFYAVSQPVAVVSTGGVDKYKITFTKTPGFFDPGLYQENLGFWYDMADHRTFASDEDTTYIESLLDKSDFQRHMENPWYPDRRPQLTDSVMKAGFKAHRNTTFASGRTFGLANPETPIWHGASYIRAFSDRIEVQFANATDNNSKTIFSGLTTLMTSLLNTNCLIIIYGDDTSCTLRINGTDIQTKTGSAYPLKSLYPFMFVHAGNFASWNVLFSNNHIGQHPFWESGSYTGDMVEMMQFYNVAGL